MLSGLFALALGGFPAAPPSVQAPDPQAGGPARVAQDEDPESDPGSERRSVFGDVLHLGDEPPEARSIAAIQLLYKDCSGAPRDLARDLDATLAFAKELREQLAAGESFEELARRYSASNTSPTPPTSSRPGAP